MSQTEQKIIGFDYPGKDQTKQLVSTERNFNLNATTQQNSDRFRMLLRSTIEFLGDIHTGRAFAMEALKEKVDAVDTLHPSENTQIASKEFAQFVKMLIDASIVG